VSSKDHTIGIPGSPSGPAGLGPLSAAQQHQLLAVALRVKLMRAGQDPDAAVLQYRGRLKNEEHVLT